MSTITTVHQNNHAHQQEISTASPQFETRLDQSDCGAALAFHFTSIGGLVLKLFLLVKLQLKICR